MTTCVPVPAALIGIGKRGQRQLFRLIETVNNDRVAVEITSRRGNAVLVSADEYAALEETAYLLRVPANAKDFWRACSRRSPVIGTHMSLPSEARACSTTHCATRPTGSENPSL